MPYIKQDHRDQLDPIIDQLVDVIRELDVVANQNNTEGNINYCITKILKSIYSEHPSYRNFNNAMGVMLSAALEYYRVDIAPYENQKMFENGEVEIKRHFND